MEASSSTSNAPRYRSFRRSITGPPPAPDSDPGSTARQRARNHCRVSVGMPVSRSRTRAAAVEGARPMTNRLPASARTWRSIVVLPVPARPCTPTIRSGVSRIVRTASSCPSVRPAPARCAATAFSRASAMPSPTPVFIAEITARSAFSARSVTNARSVRRNRASTRCASRTRHPIASRTASSVCRPGE